MSGVPFWCLNTTHVLQEANLLVRKCFKCHPVIFKIILMRQRGL